MACRSDGYPLGQSRTTVAGPAYGLPGTGRCRPAIRLHSASHRWVVFALSSDGDVLDQVARRRLALTRGHQGERVGSGGVRDQVGVLLRLRMQQLAVRAGSEPAAHGMI